jgi:hypothetical protein
VRVLRTAAAADLLLVGIPRASFAQREVKPLPQGQGRASSIAISASGKRFRCSVSGESCAVFYGLPTRMLKAVAVEPLWVWRD